MAPAQLHHQSRIASWYDKFAAFKVEDLFARKKRPGTMRTVFVNENLPEDYHDAKGRVKPEHIYPTNQVITSKYTLFTFIPRNLLEQFRRVANIFFLGIAILQFFPKFSTISPGLVILPLLIVLGITALKDGYEDIKRHQSDHRVNKAHVRVLGGGEWVNPNVMQRKSRAFVRGVLRTYRRGIKKVKRANPMGEELEGITTPPVHPSEHLEFDDVVEEHHYLPSILGSRHGHSHRGHGDGLAATAAGPDLNRPHWKKTAWEDMAVGDFVKIMDNESLPADILICATSEDENVAFVETKNLDGETNLKSRNAVPALTHLRNAAECASPHNAFRLEGDRPDVNMYKLNAAVKVGKETFPVDMQMMLLRGTVLRNTGWVVGVVLYTGEDTRIVMNSGGTPSKRSKVERQMNPQVFVNLLLLALMAIACGIVDSVLEHRDYPEGAPWLYDDNRSGDNPSINGLITFAFALITFQNIVPISLYISIEFVRTCQAAFIYFDNNMVHKDQPALARSWNLSDDLGQIEYIFSDKTGTLTQNSMIFRKCSIGGKMYNGDELEEEEEESSLKKMPSPDEKGPPPAYAPPAGISEGEKPKNLGAEIPLEQLRSSGSSSAAYQSSKTHVEKGLTKPKSSPGADSDSSDLAGPPPPPGDEEPNASTSTATPKVIHHFHDAELSRTYNSENAAHARQLNGFFSVLALCHTVLTNLDKETGKLEYKAQSPDEAALVQAAADMGFVFRGREREVLYLQTPFQGATGVVDVEVEEEAVGRPSGVGSSAGSQMSGNGRATSPSGPGVLAGTNADDGTLERYELLNILEFTSARKRMSVVLRKLDADDGRLFLLSKGADSVIFERLKKGAGEELKQVTERHLDEFASQGLRTLTLAYKVIPEDEYNAWSERYHDASVSMDDREAKVEAVSDELERDLRLLGATAIEDRLQNGVPEAIADLKRAGIKIWVATGDKLETAIAIGHSTNLIGRESNIIVIRGNRSGREVYDQIVHAVEQFFPESGILDGLENPSPAGSADPEMAETQPVRSTSPLVDNMSYMMHTQNQQQEEGLPGGPLHRTDTGISSIVGTHNGERPGGFVLVIDGTALEVALLEERNKGLLLRLAMVCEGVICCRVSPLQKAQIVKLVKDGLGVMTLAIGDGANDVSMIQAADVGVGISGEEGLQAVNSSDYAIGQFRFLKRLLLVHGHWSYARNGTMILNFFYKNILCIGCVFDPALGFVVDLLTICSFPLIVCLNIRSSYVSLPLTHLLIDDHVLMAVPELYWYGREGKWFGMRQFVVYMLDGIIQSAIIYFLILYTYISTSSRTDGWQIGIYEFSTTMVFAAVLSANFFNGLNTSAWTGWVFFCIFIGDVLVWVYTAIYNSISPGWFVTPIWGNNIYLFESAYYWLCLPLTVCLALLPRYIYKAWKFDFSPDDVDILRYIYKIDPHRDLAHEPQARSSLSALKRHHTASLISRTRSHARTGSVASLPGPSTDLRTASRTDMSTGVRSVHRGFDFSMEENGVAMRRMQSNLSERRQSSRNLATEPESGTTHRRKGTIRHVLSAPRNFLRKKGSHAKDSGQ
ncbi:hypothetical protein BDZ97DRAFT_1794193 [Flammula alnicola]|nr:hypothetical protein BDZ97DRAFT_1794193 [Flammula alnicola]